MKLLKPLIPLLCLFHSCFFLQGQELRKTKKFGPNPGKLKMFVYDAAGSKAEAGKVPLVVVLHGCSQTARSIMEKAGWDELAREHGLILLLPQQKFMNNPSKCFNWFREKDSQKGRGEAASIKHMLNYTLEHYPVDSNKVFIYGVSAGGAMSSAMMANYPASFKAGAVYAGGPYGIAGKGFKAFKAMGNPKNRSPEDWAKEVPLSGKKGVEFPELVIVHGTEDEVVSINNAYELSDQWTFLHGMDSTADTSISPYGGHPEVSRISHVKNKKERVVFYRIEGLGHALSVNPGNGKKQGGEAGLFSKDTGFFSTYYIARDFGITDRAGQKNPNGK